MTHRLAPTVALVLTVGACNGNDIPASPTTTSPPSPAGSWSGSMSDPLSGGGTMQLTLGEQSPGTLTGTWSATFGSGDTVSGVAVATLAQSNAYGVVLYADPPAPCATGSGDDGSGLLNYTLINLVITPSRLTGILGRLSCAGIAFGAIDLSRVA